MLDIRLNLGDFLLVIAVLPTQYAQSMSREILASQFRLSCKNLSKDTT